MLSADELRAWLVSANARYSAEGVPHKKRPFEALSDFTRERQCTIDMSSPLAKRIFEWFYANSPPGAHLGGSVYTGLFYFDVAFWPVNVPLIFGTVSVNAIDCLGDMPVQTRNVLASSRDGLSAYATHWCNCMDYGYGMMDLRGGSKLQARASKFLGAAHQELVGANSQLLNRDPNAKAILGMRMATEIFMKTILVQERGLSESELKDISHGLKGAAEACADTTQQDEFREIGALASVFPPISARYDNTNWPYSDVWQAALLAQRTGAMVTRMYTDRDTRSAVVYS
jgi:hypothetical protein